MAFFLIVFQPFTINNSDGSWRFALTMAGYGFLTTLILLFNEFVIWPLGQVLFSNGFWIKKRDLFGYVWHFATVAIGMMLYREYLIFGILEWPPFPEMLTMIYRTIMVGLIPLTIFLFGQQILKLKEEVGHLIRQPMTSRKICLSAENEKTKLRIAPEDLLFITCCDNYADVFFQKNGVVKKIVLRSSLTRLEQMIKEQLC